EVTPAVAGALARALGPVSVPRAGRAAAGADVTTASADAPRPDRAELTATLGQALDLLACGERGIAVLDDLQWATPPALDLLDHLLLRSDPSPWLFVATVRDQEPAEVDHGVRLARLLSRAGVRRLDLLPLTHAETLALVESMLPFETKPRLLADR